MSFEPTELLIAANRAALAGFPGLARALVEVWRRETGRKP